MRGRPALLHAPLLLALALAVPGPAAAEAQDEPDEPPAGDVADEGPPPGEDAPWAPDLTTPLPPAPPPAPTPVPGEGASAADSAKEPEPEPEEEPRPKPGEGTWLDASHGFLESKLFAPVIRFDRFFSDETELEPERARSFLRWRNEVRLEQAGDPRYTTSVRANLRFPAITRALRRLRLVLEGETRDAFDALFPGEEPGDGDAPLGQADAELRLRLWDGLLAHADLGAGLLFELPPGAFGRLRLRWEIPVGDVFLTRLATIGFYRTDEGFGVSTDVHLERPFSRQVLTRLSSGGRLTERSPGVEWRSELAMFVALSRRAAAAVGVGVNGATERVPELDRFRVFTRLRRDFYRRWLFFELEPEYYWPYTPERGRHATWAVTARLEVQFQGRERERDPADEEPTDPPPPPEPRGTGSPRSGPG